MSLLVQSFKVISRGDVETAGGKGASLGEMTNAGIPVPLGFVVLAGAFEQFLTETDLNVEIDTILHSVDIEKMHTVEHASETIQKLILEAKMSEDIEREIREQFKVLGSTYVAVRSSATAEDSNSAAWAGQLDTFLNTTEETLLENVQKCWASLFTPRAIFYRFEKGLHASKISVAVVIQKMVQSEVSGIAFSVHPVTEDPNQLIIEAGLGLGEAIVSGQITPDSYVVEKEPRRIIDTNVSKQTRGIFRNARGGNEWRELGSEGARQKLTPDEIFELSEIILKIERHYGFPCDVEWAREDGKFYIVQSRPITTLAETKPESISKNQESIFNPQDYLSLGRWVAPTLAVVPWMRWSEGKIFKDLAISIESPNHVHIGGYSLWPISLKAAIEQAFLSDIESGRFILVQKYLSYAQIELETFLEYTTKVKNFDDANATIALRDFFSAYEKVIPAWLIAFFLGPIVEGRLRTVVDRYSLNADTVLSAITSERRTFSQLARQELREIKKKIISQGLFEFIELNKPEVLLQNSEIQSVLSAYVEKWEWIETHHVSGDPLTLEKVLNELKDLKEDQPKEDISIYPEELQKLLEIAGDLAWLRLQSAETSAMVSFAARPLIRFLGDKIGLSYDEVIWLTAEEIINHVETKTLADKQEVSERIKAWGGYRSTDTVLEVLTGEELNLVLGPLIPKHNLNVDELKGTIGYKGKVTGRVRVMLTPRSDKAFVDGEILIASETTPDYVPIMKRALAFVTDQGGITSHAAIISRELQKPCIVGTKIATQVLHDGDLVEVDAEEGVVRIIKKVGSENIDFKERKWVVYGASGWPAYITPFGVVPSRKFFEMYGVSTEGIGLWEKSNFDWLFDEEELNAFATIMLPKLLKRPWGYYDDWQIQSKKFDCLHQQLWDADVTAYTDEILQEWTKKYYETFMTQYAVSNFIEPLSFYFQNNLRDLLVHEGVENSHVGMLIDTYGTSSKPNYIKQCIEEYKKIKNENEIDFILKKFHYLKNDYTGSHQVIKRDLEELAKQKTHDKSSIVRDEALSKRAKDLLTVLQMMATLQDVRKAQSLMWISGAEKIVIELAGRVDIPVEELLFATWEEIIARNFDREELKHRKEGCVIDWQAYKTNVYSGVRATQMMRDFKKMLVGEEMKRKEILGISASGGTATGHVAVVLDSRQLHKVKEGDILVTMMTRPEYLPMMRLAGAFVTDEGGITSHAAIIAREMRKPCIIGTKIATKILHDGDLVEVDAEEGIVSIIEKSK